MKRETSDISDHVQEAHAGANKYIPQTMCSKHMLVRTNGDTSDHVQEAHAGANN